MLLSYLKRHYKIILMLCLFVGIFAAVFSLYALPVEAVWYAALLCAAAGAALFFLGYGSYLSRHRALSALQSRVTLSLDDLPPARGALERDYQALLALLFSEKRRVEARSETERRDLVDYYTLWAHQIKTPIAAMRLLLREEDSAQNARLDAELFSIERYVEMVLSYLRLDAETTDFLLREYELDDILRQALRKYARLFIMQKLSLDFRETGLRVLTDEKWLLFVVEQLLSNALKYTREGKISLFAEGTSLIVADTGIGVRPEDLPRVFEKGFTGYNGRADKKSTGIGLYLCRRVCDKLGHGIRMASRPGAGTRVCVDLSRRERVVE